MKKLIKRKVFLYNKINRKKIYNLATLIKADDVGNLWWVYVGNKFLKIVILRMMVGLSIGQFVFTRGQEAFIHKKKKKKKKKGETKKKLWELL